MSSVCYKFFESFLCDVCHIVLLCVAPRVLGWVRVLGFSGLGPLASRVRGFIWLLGCLYQVGRVGALGGLLGVWGESCCGGFDAGAWVCIMKGVRFKGKPSRRRLGPGSA